MKYSYHDLGEQPNGTSVSVKLTGSSANVILLDAVNFARYRAREPFSYTGGLQVATPARLTIPRDDHWFVVVDLGGYSGRVRAAVEVHPPETANAPDDAAAAVPAGD
jgi:Domain of unknown function (DUF1883)